jgi:hypothetical protein
MSAIERQHREPAPQEVIVRTRPAARRLRLRWSVSGEAAAACGLTPEGTRQAWLELEVDVQRRDGATRATSVSAAVLFHGRASPVEIAPATGAAITDAETGLTHIDIDGFIHATLRGESDVLYARTPLLSRLGLPGGRYECEGLSSRE